MNWVFPSAGQRFFLQKPLESYTPKALARYMAWVPAETPIPLFQFTVHDILKMGRYPFQAWLGRQSTDDLELIQTTAGHLNLLPLLDHRIDTLSSGEWQRVLIAKALVQSPTLLLLDEPFTHQDAQNTLALIRYLKNSELTILVISHDHTILDALTPDRIIL